MLNLNLCLSHFISQHQVLFLTLCLATLTEISKISKGPQTVTPSAPQTTMANDFLKDVDMKSYFAKVASKYDEQAGPLTRAVSRHLIAISSPPLSNKSVVLDNATGPGITCSEIMALPASQHPKELHATDLSPDMTQQVELRGFGQIKTAVMDAQDLKFPDDKFSHVYMAFVIFAVPDPKKAAEELYRTLQPGGSAYVTTWQDLAWAVPTDRALKAVRPDNPTFKGPVPAEWLTADKLKEVLISGGFAEEKVDVHGFESTATPEIWDGSLEFLKMGILNGVIGQWSDEEKQKFFIEVEGEFAKEKAKGGDVAFPSWVGVARK